MNQHVEQQEDRQREQRDGVRDGEQAQEKRKRKGAGLRPVVLKKAAGGEKYPGQERLGAGFGDRPTDIDVGQEVGAVEVGDGGDKRGRKLCRR